MAMIIEVKLVGESDRLWMDIGPACHVCFDRAMLKTYTATED